MNKVTPKKKGAHTRARVRLLLQVSVKCNDFVNIRIK